MPIKSGSEDLERSTRSGPRRGGSPAHGGVASAARSCQPLPAGARGARLPALPSRGLDSDSMRIAQIAPLAESVPPTLYGGTERVVAWLVDELVALGHDVNLVREW